MEQTKGILSIELGFDQDKILREKEIDIDTLWHAIDHDFSVFGIPKVADGYYACAYSDKAD